MVFEIMFYGDIFWNTLSNMKRDENRKTTSNTYCFFSFVWQHFSFCVAIGKEQVKAVRVVEITR